jgi:hypothetical protein
MYKLLLQGGVGPFKLFNFGQPLTETAPLASNVYTFTGLFRVTYFYKLKMYSIAFRLKEFTTPPPLMFNITVWY